MSKGLVAKVSIRINAPVEKVWDALTNPTLIKKYMFGTDVLSDWKEGASIKWKGIWNGKSYEDKGVILQKVPMKTLRVTHFSPLSGLPDEKENYHTLIYDLSSRGGSTILNLSQDNNSNEISRDHSQKNWEMMLENIKKTLEE